MQRFLSTKEQKRWSGRLQGLRTSARKANEFGFRTQTGAPERAEKVVRVPAGFAYDCPQSQWIRFSYANRGTGKSRKGGPGACRVCVRLPAKPMNTVFVRKPPGRKKEKRRSGRRRLPSPKRKKPTVPWHFPSLSLIFPGGSALFPGGSALFHLNLADFHGVQCIPVLLRGDAGTAFFQDPDWGFREGCFENHGVGNHTDIRAQTY